MKKIVLFLFVAIATLSVKAQDLYMGGTVGLWRNDDANTTSFKIGRASCRERVCQYV